MPLSPEEHHRLVAAFTAKVPQMKVCRICDAKHFNLLSSTVTLLVSDDLEVLRVEKTAPCLAVTCENCGYTYLFNLLVLGLDSFFRKNESTGP